MTSTSYYYILVLEVSEFSNIIMQSYIVLVV